MNLSWDYSESNLSDTRRNASQANFSSENDFGSFSSTNTFKPKSKTLCKFYMVGKCSFGGRCQFSHGQASDSGSDYCSFYRAGHCKYGSSCALKHDNKEPDISFLTSNMEKLDFSSNLPVISSEIRNSLLPSFLVDELLLDENDHHHQQSPAEPEPAVFYERSSSVSPVSFEANETIYCPPTSYGEAIADGLKFQNIQAGISLSPEDFYSSIQEQEEEYDYQGFSQDRLDDLCAFSKMGK